MRDREQVPRGLTSYKVLAISPWFHHFALAVAITAIYITYGHLPSYNNPSTETIGTEIFDVIAAYSMVLFLFPPLWFPGLAILAWYRLPNHRRVVATYFGVFTVGYAAILSHMYLDPWHFYDWLLG